MDAVLIALNVFVWLFVQGARAMMPLFCSVSELTLMRQGSQHRYLPARVMSTGVVNR
jgi:hypothetical protein